VSSNDLLQYWATDPATRVIALYLETFGNPRRFGRLARRIGREKPIIAIKSGRTRAGSKAAGSHTAALAASDVAVSALFRQTGVIRADTIDEMFDIAACLASQPLPRGRRVAIVTNAGGPGILAADACEGAGLTVADLSPETRARLAAILPGVASLGNPVDMIASAGPDQYRQVIEAVLQAAQAGEENGQAGEVDALLVIYTAVDPVGSAPIVAAIRDGVLAGRSGGGEATILACLVAELDPARLDTGTERIPVYAFPENAVRALGKIAEYAEWRARPPGVRERFEDVRPETARSICRAVLATRGADWLDVEEVRRVLDAYGLTVVPSVLAHSREEAASAAEVMGFPVVAKLSSPSLLHKTEAGGVMVNLDGHDAVAAAFDTLSTTARVRDLPLDGVLLQPMSPRGIETIIGMHRDPTFGPIVGFGLGGTEVEVLGDMRFRVAPLADRDIADLVGETRAARLIAGHRGRPPADIAALIQILARLSRLAEDVPEIAELDLNPVIVLPAGEGCDVVDVRMRVG
jgi:acyl-CoA synthetase (NDP forming)